MTRTKKDFGAKAIRWYRQFLHKIADTLLSWEVSGRNIEVKKLSDHSDTCCGNLESDVKVVGGHFSSPLTILRPIDKSSY